MGWKCLPQEMLLDPVRIVFVLAHCPTLFIIQMTMLLTAASLRRLDAAPRKVPFVLVSALARSSIPAEENGQLINLLNSG
jgi:hypothetical protein